MTAWATDRLGDLVGVDAELDPGVLGPGPQLTSQVGDKHQLTRLAFGVAGEQGVDQAAGGLGNSGVQQRAGANDEDGAGLELASGGWWEEQAEVAVGDPARFQDLAESIRAELVHCPPPAPLAMDVAGSGYPASRAG
jgi:hypothetical protein